MKRIWYLLAAAALLGGVFWLGTLSGGPDSEPAAGSRAERRIRHYVDPMNPAHTSDNPGIAPCGMDMVPVYADDPAAGSPLDFLPGTAKITPEKQQIMGVRLDRAVTTTLSRGFRTLGRIAVIENNVHTLTAGASGWVWDINGSYTGGIVEKDALMATVYNYDFLTRQQQYLYALDFDDRKKQQAAQLVQESAAEGADSAAGAAETGERTLASHLSAYSMVPTTPGGINPTSGVVFTLRDQLEIARLELYSLGVTEYQIAEITRQKKIMHDIEIRSPVRGLVLSRNISPQQRFDKGAVLFRVADVRKVWVLADVFERDAEHIAPGMKAMVSLPGRDLEFAATVTETPPVFDPAARSWKVQLLVDNPEFVLRPEMYVDVRFVLDFPAGIVVPIDAVIDTGLKKIVFVERGNGYFEPRSVTTGGNFGDRIEVVSGLAPGEWYAVSGAFLLHSESRMQMAAAGHGNTEETNTGDAEQGAERGATRSGNGGQ